MNTLHRILKAVKELHHLAVHLALESSDKVLHHNTIGPRKER